MKKIQKYAALFSILLMFFMDVISIGLAYPIFSSMFFCPDCHVLAAGTSQAIRGIWLGIILALVPIGQFFSAPVLGTFSDRIGRKKLLLTTIALGSIGYFVAVCGVWLEQVLLLAFSRIVIGIATGNQAIGSAVIADISEPEEKTKNFGLLHMAGGFGFTVGPFLGGILSKFSFGSLSGYAIPFACAGMLTIINLVLVALLYQETHKPIQQQQDVLSFGLRNIKRAWRMPGLSLLFVAIFVYNFGWSFYWDFIPVNWIALFKFDASGVYNRYALGALVYALSSGILIRPFIARFKSQTLLFYGLIGGALCIGVPLFYATPNIYWILIPLQQYAISLIFPVAAALVSNKSSAESQGEMMGIFESVQSFAMILCPIVAGVLIGISLQMPLIVGTLGLLLAAYIVKRADH